MFGDCLLSVDWVSKINLTKAREDEIEKCFKCKKVEFHYPNDSDELDLIIDTFKKDSFDQDNEETNNNFDCNIFGENKTFDRLIVMDNVSGLADKSNDFSNFLTVSRKFGYICLYIFHIIYPTKSIWQMILSQTKIFNIFLLSIQLGNILKISTNKCSRDTTNYIPARGLWINRLDFSLSNESKYSCLTIDYRKSGPAKYRTKADNNFEQFCYFHQNKKDRLFNTFLAKRVEENNNSLVFKIDSVTNTTKNGETKIYRTIQELKSFDKSK